MTGAIETAYITGAASGIGAALARKLAAQGVHLYLTDINADALASLKDDLSQHHNHITTEVLDVADRTAIRASADKAIDALGHVDAVFNNAGVSLSDPIERLTDDDMDWIIDINFWGVVTGTKAFLRHMRQNGRGHIINISSILGHVSVPGGSMYCASKHAVKAFNESLLHELTGSGISVHSVHPGGVDTGIVTNGRHRHSGTGKADAAQLAKQFKDHMVYSTPTEAADQIMHGVEGGKFHILVGPDAKRMHFLNRLFPNWFRRQVGKKSLG